MSATKWLAAGAAVAALAIGAGDALAQGKTLRLAINNETTTFDPHANNAFLNNMTLEQVYECLTTRGKNLEVEPALATRWEMVQPNRWRFHLRDGVKWHDGSPFTADDVVFTIGRALAPTSNYTIYMDSIAEAVRVDDRTVDIVTKVTDAILPDKLTRIFVMQKRWSEANKVEKPHNYAAKEENFATRNAMGTGPYKLRLRQADVRTEMEVHPGWWGKREGNIDLLVQIPITNDATRISALVAGDVDITNFVPYQDLERLKRDARIKVVEGMENRTVFLGFDQFRDELKYSDVKGKNPFKDRRVREAVALSIDVEAIKSRVLRNQAVPTGSMWTHFVNGYAKDLDVRPPLDRARAKQLLTEAGYPNGFKVTLDCPQGNYAEACVAIAPQLAQIGIAVDVNLMPPTITFQKFAAQDTSFFGLSWGVPTLDALYTLRGIVMSKGKVGAGSWNAGGYANAQVDSLIEKVGSEPNAEARRGQIREALRIHNAEYGHVPLYHIVIPWAMNAKVTAHHRADNFVVAKWVKYD
ncbi:MAG: ABC transporter substrate-binding protein [Alphaproteobacteria bacterium]|nr:ABC transporter substrate-binding protein [Alphaproteobacteria bacterium]